MNNNNESIQFDCFRGCMVTHDKETANRVSHKTVLLSDGEIIKITTNPNP